MHEYGTRPFLRWAQSQGRSLHPSSKAKNTFDPVGIPLFGAPGNKLTPSPEGGKRPGGWPPEAGGTLPVPRHTQQNRLEIKRPPDATQQLEKKDSGRQLIHY